jgi:hypothetical protein
LDVVQLWGVRACRNQVRAEINVAIKVDQRASLSFLSDLLTATDTMAAVMAAVVADCEAPPMTRQAVEKAWDVFKANAPQKGGGFSDAN